MLGLLGWPAFVRINYARASALRSAGWLFQARAAGLRSSQLGLHLLPHLRPILLSQFLIYIPVYILGAGRHSLDLSADRPARRCAYTA
jgi:ABC-type dipeptide/oligopeptide/nickel transport system permease subunit